MSKRLILLVLAAQISLFLTACLPHEYAGTILDPPKPIEDFTLEIDDNNTARLSNYQGKIVLLYFGYTFCPDVCPTTMVELKKMMQELGSNADEVQVIMISVDPERDSAEHLDRYAKNFHESFIGMRTDDMTYLEENVLQQFGIFYEYEEVEDSAAGYLVSHSASVIVLDKDLQWRMLFPYGTPGESMAADIKQLFKEK